ncbi:MAG: hypothetical protein AUK47_23430 [Deltaproteobacteria bacterium CG2_30_63_29]|nr:MAG: hypothetical protein AUK47_23430 [Deltaproteobacteria bacterium CG2_30_63_29]
MLLFTGLSCEKKGGEPGDDLTPCWNFIQLQRRLGSQIGSDVPGVYRLNQYVVVDGVVLPPDVITCTTEIASRLQQACGFCNKNSKGCEGLVRSIFESPPGSCSACGDHICVTESENELSCPSDCGAVCGDLECSEKDGETRETCPLDCDSVCGNGLCSAFEDPTICPQDCNYTVGDGLCSPGENPVKSRIDCQRDSCGDGYCQSYEDSLLCPDDCCAGAICQNRGNDQFFCIDERQVGRCVQRGAGGCPELEISEVCDVSCGPHWEPASGYVEGCMVCPESVFNNDSLPDNDLTVCEPGGPPTCSPAGELELCLPLPGFPGCHALERVSCSPSDAVWAETSGDGSLFNCVPGGGCMDCPEDSCLPPTKRCMGTTTLENCVMGAGETCGHWEFEATCGSGEFCNLAGRDEVVCDSCCGVGTKQCQGGTTIRECLKPDADWCGYWSSEAVMCGPNQRCDTDSNVTCEDCCTPSSVRCSDTLATIEVCQEAVPWTNCGRWQVQQYCGGGSLCVDWTPAVPTCEDCCNPGENRCEVTLTPGITAIRPCDPRPAPSDPTCEGFWSTTTDPCPWWMTCMDSGSIIDAEHVQCVCPNAECVVGTSYCDLNLLWECQTVAGCPKLVSTNCQSSSQWCIEDGGPHCGF